MFSIQTIISIISSVVGYFLQFLRRIRRGFCVVDAVQGGVTQWNGIFNKIEWMKMIFMLIEYIFYYFGIGI